MPAATPNFWHTAARLAWRDLRTSRLRASLIVITLALSIAGVGGVYSAAAVTRAAFLTDAKAFLAADFAVDLTDPILPRQAAALDSRKSDGLQWTLLSTTLTSASSTESPDPAVVAVKAIDPALYPFYGRVTLSSGQTLAQALTPDTAVLSRDVLERLEIKIGDTIRIAGQPFRIAAVILIEPDRLSGSGGIGMRCILSREGYARTSIERAGNSVKNRVLLRLPSSANVESERQYLTALFPGGSVRDYRGALRTQTETSISFLSITAFLALALGAIGAATAVRQHAEQCLPSLAIMRILGARTRQMAAVFFLQIAWMAAAAILVAIPLVLVIRASILSLSASYLDFPSPPGFDYAALGGSLLAALALMAPVLAQPALLIRNLRPAILLRYDAERRAVFLPAIARGRTGWLSIAIACLAFSTLAWSMLRSWSTALLLAGALALVAMLSFALAAVVLRLTKKLHFSTTIWKHGMAGLARPGNRSLTLVTALATACTVMIATFEAGGALTRALTFVLPYDRDSLYIAGFKDSGRDKMRAFLEQQPGAERVEILTMVRLNLRKLEGITPGIPHFAVCDAVRHGSASGPANLVMASDLAHRIGARIGDRFEFETRDRVMQAELVQIRKLTAAERVWSTLKLDCSGIEESSLFHYAAVLTRPGASSNVRREILAPYPTLAVLTAEDLSETVSATARDAMKLARIVTWYALGAGLCVLIAAISASQASRLQEIGILSAVGARPRVIRAIYTIEFASIGAISGTISALLACGFASVVTSIIAGHFDLALDWKASLAAIAAAIVFAVAGGWLPVYDLLKRRPLEALRELR